MSLAAKSGQMQVFNNLHSQNLNQAASRSEGQSLAAHGHHSGLAASNGAFDGQNNIGGPIKNKAGAVMMSTNMGPKHQLPPHPSGSGSHKQPSSLNPNTVIGNGPGMSTSAASGNANSSLNVPSSAHSKQSGANPQTKIGMQQVPM